MLTFKQRYDILCLKFDMEGNLKIMIVEDIVVPTYSDLVQTFTGRRTLLTSLTDLTKENVVDVIKYYFDAHCLEVPTMQFLYQFDLGIQPILEEVRTKINTDENNLVVINLARTARKLMQSAFLGEQLQYVSKEKDGAEATAVEKLKYIYDEMDEAEHNIRLENDRGIVGIAYEYTSLPRQDDLDYDESIIQMEVLSPLRTRIVKYNGLGKKDAFGFTFYTRYDEKNQNPIGYTFNVYTRTKTFKYNTSLNAVSDGSEIEVYDNPTGKLPITEYVNNSEKMGDFEAAIPILNAINTIFSKRVDNVCDIVDSFLVWVNCSIFDEIPNPNGDGTTIYDTTRLEAFKKNKAIEIKGEAGLPADLKHVVVELDQSQIQVLVDSLTKYAFAVMFTPNPIESRSSGSSDSAEAVSKNEGWKSQEDILKAKERYFRKGLKNRIKIIQRLKLFDGVLNNLNAGNIDIKFIRSKVLNTQSNAQALDILRKTGLFSDETLASLSNLIEDPVKEIKKKFEELDKLVKDGVITEKQKGMIRLSCLYPSLDISKIFVNEKTDTVDIENKEKEVLNEA